MRCCRKPSARAAATRPAAPTPQALARAQAADQSLPTGWQRRNRRAGRPARTASRAARSGLRSARDPDPSPVIDAAACIGCARCLPACPVDAILGAAPITAHRARPRLQRLRAVPGCLPGRLHRDAAARSRASRRPPRPTTASATSAIASAMQRAAREREALLASASGRTRGLAAMSPAAVPADLHAPARGQSASSQRAAIRHAVRTADRGDPVGAGHRQERQSRHARAVPRRADAGGHAQARAWRASNATSAPSASSTPRQAISWRPAGSWSSATTARCRVTARSARGAAGRGPQDRQRGTQRRLR